MFFFKTKFGFSNFQATSRSAFTFIETITAVIILALICSSILVIINRNLESAADSVTKIRAFEIVRENLESLLAKNDVTESIEFGQSEKYPEIEWKTAVETFYEPATSNMWLQANCQATYYDSKDEQQTIELTHWLSKLTDEQVNQILSRETDPNMFYDPNSLLLDLGGLGLDPNIFENLFR